MQRYKPFLKAFNDHTFSLSLFFSQAKSGIRLNPYLGRADRKKALEAGGMLGLDRKSSKLATLNLANTIKSLTRFQRQLRQALGRYFAAGTLDRLETEEQVILRRLWNVWYFFTFHPERVLQNAVADCSNESAKVLRTIRLDLRGKLRRLSTAGPRISIVSETAHWDEQPAMWLTVDGRQVVDVLGALGNIFDAVREAVRKVRKTEFRDYVLDMNWPYVVIIPLVRGKSASNSAWRVMLPTILESAAQGMKWTSYSPQQIPPELLEHLKIDSWNLPQLQVSAKLLQSTVVLSQNAAHIRDLRRIPDLDEQGLAQLQTYIDSLSGRSNEALQSYLDTVVEMLAAYNKLPDAERENRPALVEMALSLIELNKNVLPSPDFESHATMNLEELTEWASRLDNAPLQALVASSAWMTDVFDQTGA